MSEENCAACPSGLEYATEDQLLGVILSHHALLAAKDAESAELRKERDAALAQAKKLKEENEGLWRMFNPIRTAAYQLEQAVTALEEGRP